MLSVCSSIRDFIPCTLDDRFCFAINCLLALQLPTVDKVCRASHDVWRFTSPYASNENFQLFLFHTPSSSRIDSEFRRKQFRGDITE